MNVNENKTTSESQNKMVAAWLNDGNSLTQMGALKMFGCFRLASRIFDLRERGMNIVTEKVTLSNGKRIAVYKLNTNEQ